jgi:hypothetical protein
MVERTAAVANTGAMPVVVRIGIRQSLRGSGACVLLDQFAGQNHRVAVQWHRRSADPRTVYRVAAADLLA